MKKVNGYFEMMDQVLRPEKRPCGRIKVDVKLVARGGIVELYADENKLGYQIGDFIKAVRVSELERYKGNQGYTCVVFRQPEI